MRTYTVFLIQAPRAAISTFVLILFLSGRLFAQDTIFTTNGTTIPGKVLEISETDIKYKKSSMPDGPTYIQKRRDIKEIHYANGQKEVFNDGSAPPPPENSGPVVITMEKVDSKTNTSTGTGNPPEKTPPENDPNADYYGGGPTYATGNQIAGHGSLYIYQNHRITEKKLHLLLNDTGDKQIIALTGKAKDKHKLQYIGFAAFPIGIIGLVVASTATHYDQYGAVKSVDYGQQTAGILLSVGALACPAISIKAKIDRKRYNREAIKLYNQKF